jgi:nitrate reductase assembly molybdenum cofactor insertion protein NarJ
MKYKIAHYDFLADVYAYPEGDFTKKIETAQRFFDNSLPEAGELFRPFADYMSTLSIFQQQELFIRSFDVQAVTTLDLGYVLFGDDYKRGELLVNLNREHREAGNDCGVELADHLSNLLRLLPKMQDEVLLEELSRRIVWAALKRMIRGFEPEQIELKDKFYQKKHKTILERPENHYTIYVRALQALYRLLQYDFGFEERELPEQVSDFLKNLHTEVKLEGD